MERKVYIKNTPLEQALELFLKELEDNAYFSLEKERIEVLSSLGRILASRLMPAGPHPIIQLQPWMA